MPTAKRKKSAAKSAARKSTRKNSVRSVKRPPVWKNPALRTVLWCAAVLLTLFLLFLAGSLLIFSPYRALGAPRLGDRHYQTLNRVTSRTASQTFSRRPPEEARLRLSPDEVNDLLDLARGSSGFSPDMPPPWSFSAAYRPDGSFSFTVPIDAAPAWFFGGKIYADGSFRLEKQGEKLMLELPELRIGRAGLSIPGGSLLAGNTGEAALKKAIPPEFDAAIKDFYSERDGTLVVVYRPAMLLPLLLKITR